MKIKSNNKHRGMHVDRELTKTSLQTKKEGQRKFQPRIFFAFFFSVKVFFQNMQREKTALKVLYAVGLLIKSVLLCYTAAQQLEATGQPEVSKFGMMLQRHIFKRITGAGLSDVCLRGCYADVRCQSFNYVFTQDICELSNRTKEARPEDYVPNPERFYFKRDYKRGFYTLNCLIRFKDIFRAQKLNPKLRNCLTSPNFLP